MDIKNLIPWKKNETPIPVQRGQEGDAFLNLQEDMNRMFDSFFDNPFRMAPFFNDAARMSAFAPNLDIAETDSEITISAELPGLEPEDINIMLDHGMLTISGEKRAEKEEKGKRYYRVERSYGAFHRSISLPNEVEEDQIDATFKRGVLQVRLPKTKAAREQRKRIAVKSG